MWDKRYASTSYADGTQANDFLCEQASLLPVGDTLCLGEGEFHDGTSAVVQVLARKPQEVSQ